MKTLILHFNWPPQYTIHDVLNQPDLSLVSICCSTVAI